MFFTWVARRRYSRPWPSTGENQSRATPSLTQVALRFEAEAFSTAALPPFEPTYQSA